MIEEPKRKENPYYVQQTPRGSVVVCGEHLITDEVKPGEAHALANALNMEHRSRVLFEQTRTLINERDNAL
jgi:hypothetical protein